MICLRIGYFFSWLFLTKCDCCSMLSSWLPAILLSASGVFYCRLVLYIGVVLCAVVTEQCLFFSSIEKVRSFRILFSGACDILSAIFFSSLQVFRCATRWEEELAPAWGHCWSPRSGRSTLTEWWWRSLYFLLPKCRTRLWSPTTRRFPCTSLWRTRTSVWC